jgi:thiol:disulfide interchange protein DsbD
LQARCVSAPLAGVLTFIAQSGQVQLGGLILFTMACGMGVPLLLFAIGASRIVPRAGKWMIRVQRFFGILMILLALWVMLPALQSLFKDKNEIGQIKSIGNLSYEIVTTKKMFDEKLNSAYEKKLRAMVIFSADWCVSCKELELNVFANEKVSSKLKDYARIEFDITQMTTEQKQILKRL